MLDKFKNKNPLLKFLWAFVILLIVCISFIGIKNLIKINKPGYYAGEIFGKKVPAEEYKKAYDRLTAITRFHYGDMFDSIAPLIDLEDQTWENLMLLKEAGKRGISASNKEIISEIASYKFFYRNKKFDTILYKNIIRNALKIEPREFEESISDFIIKRKLTEQVTSSISVSEEEILKEYKDRYEKIQTSYIEVPLENYEKDILISDQEMQEYYKGHNKELLKPKSVNVEYIALDFPEKGGVQKQVEMKYKAKAIVDEYNKTKDFKSSAEKLKFTVKETGLFSKNEPDYDIGIEFAYIMNLFKAKKGEVLEPFKTEKGYVVVRIKDKKNPYIPGFEEAKEGIKKILITNKARISALEQAKKYHEQIMSKWTKLSDTKKDFSKVAKDLKLDVKQTPELSKVQAAYTLGLMGDFEKYASNLYDLTEKDPISQPTLTQKGACIFHLKKLEPFNEEQFKKDKEAFSKNLLEMKKEKAFSSFLKELKEKANLTYFN